MERRTILLCVGVLVARGAGFESIYPYTHTNCGVTQVIQDTPRKVVCMNHGATEFMLAMGLQNYIVGQGYPPDEIDPIWPRYSEAYKAITFTAPDYPSAQQIVDLQADFVFASWMSAFQESGSIWGVNWNETLGPCDGLNSDFFPAGTNVTTKFSTCRPQLHAAGIGTWFEPISCEDPGLKKPPTQETLYEAIATLGNIFNVPTVAQQLIADIKNDFLIAKSMLTNSPSPSRTAVWLDGIGCDDDPEKVRCSRSNLGASSNLLQGDWPTFERTWRSLGGRISNLEKGPPPWSKELEPGRRDLECQHTNHARRSMSVRVGARRTSS